MLPWLLKYPQGKGKRLGALRKVWHAQLGYVCHNKQQSHLFEANLCQKSVTGTALPVRALPQGKDEIGVRRTGLLIALGTNIDMNLILWGLLYTDDQK